MNQWISILLCMGLLGVSSVASAGCKFERVIERTVDVAGAETLEVDAGAGGLYVKGGARDSIGVYAKLCANDKQALEQMDVVIENRSGLVHIETQYPKNKRFWGSTSAAIDLGLLVPQSMKLVVADSSGDASVDYVAGLQVKDSSGALKITRIGGDVSVIDSSGDLMLKEISGDANVTDSSGDLKISNLAGSVTVEADSSGDITIADVKRDVLIMRDSSGSIRVRGVDGDFTVKADTSGEISFDAVAGRVSLPESKR